MAHWDGGFSGRPVILRLHVNQDAQSVEGNWSRLGIALEAIKTGNTTAWNNNPAYWKINVNGSEWTGSWTYNFNGGIGQAVQIRGWFQHDVGHNADGTKTVSTYADASDPSGYLGFASCGGSLTLSTIPRATTAGFTSPMVMDTNYTINLPRASGGFVHTIDAYFGSDYQRVATDVGASTTWTPPSSIFLDQIPNSETGWGFLRTHTYSSAGGPMIGYKDQTIGLTAPAAAVPDFTTVTHSEATPGLATNVGKYVQGISKLNLAITGATGYVGSTVTGYKIEVGGQVVNAQSGVTSAPIAASGASVPIKGTITDSRGRTKTKTVNVEVLPYAPPILNAVTVERALVNGVVNEEGSYLRVNVNAAVQSLMNGTQRNTMFIKTSTRLRGETAWTLKETYTVPASAVTFNNFRVIGTYSIEQAYDVLVEVSDEFSTSAQQFSIPTAAIFMHWDGKDGIGIGKYRTNGNLDVLGQIYQNDGNPVLDTTSASRLALLSETYRGEASALITFQDLAGGTANAEFQQPYVPAASRMVFAQKTLTGWDIVRQSGKSYHGSPARLPLSNGWFSYRELTNDQQWADAIYAKFPSGIVALGGLLYPGTVTTGTVIGTLPPGFRPDSKMIFPVNNGDNARAIAVHPDGTITTQSGWVSNYVSLDGIAFPAAGVATWTNVGESGSGSAFANGWVDYGDAAEGLARYWKDPYGFVWFAGAVKSGSNGSDNINIISLPATHRAHLEHHIAVPSQDNFGSVGARPGDGINWKANTSGNGSIHLSGVTVVTSDAISNNPWRDVVRFSNGWTNHGASFTQAAQLRREDGLTFMKGLVSNGTFTQPLAVLDEENSRGPNALITTVSNANRGRLDLRGKLNPGPSNVVSPQQGSAWFSLDNAKWIPFR